MTISLAFNPDVQLSQNGMLSDAFVTRYQAVRARHKIPVWRVAEAAKFSPAYLGNATRFWGDSKGDKLNVSTAFASRLAAVVEALEQAKTDAEVEEALNPNATAAPAASAVAPSTQRDDAADEDDGQASLEYALAILRRHGITSITLTTPR